MTSIDTSSLDRLNRMYLHILFSSTILTRIFLTSVGDLLRRICNSISMRLFAECDERGILLSNPLLHWWTFYSFESSLGNFKSTLLLLTLVRKGSCSSVTTSRKERGMLNIFPLLVNFCYSKL